MSIKLQILLIIVILFFFGVILYLLKKKKLNLRYTLIWLLASIALIFISLFPGGISYLAKIIGIIAPSNLIFVIEAVFVVLILLSLTVIVSHMTEQIFKLTQTIAILEKRVRELEQEQKKDNICVIEKEC